MLHLVGTAQPGGVETFVLNLARFADRARCALDVCVTDDSGPIADELRALDIPVRLLGRASRVGQGWRLFEYARRHRADILHANIGGRGLRYAARAAGCAKSLLHLHAPPAGLPRNDARARTRLLRIASGATRIVACSHALARWVRAAAPGLDGRIEVVHNGIDMGAYDAADGDAVRHELSIPRDAVIAGFVGRLVRQKGIVHLARVAAHVLAKRPNVHVVVAGDGPLRMELEQTRESSGRLHLLGMRRDVPSLMHAFDMLLVPSEWEPLGVVSMEAMAAARPVVAFGVDGIPEVVIDGETGLLAPPGDEAALAERVLRLVDDADSRERLGRAGRRRVETEFDARVMAERFVCMYEDMAAPGRARPAAPWQPGHA